MAKGAALGVAGMPFKPIKSIVGDAVSMKSRDLGSRLLNTLGLGISGGTEDKNGVKDPDGKSESKNNEKAEYGSGNKAKDAIKNDGFKTSFNSNNANNQTSQKKNDMLTNAIKDDKNDQKDSSSNKNNNNNENSSNVNNNQNQNKEGDKK